MFRYSVDSEYKLLKAVLLCKPQPKIGKIGNPKEVFHLERIDYAFLKKEFEQIIEVYKRLKVRVFFINPLKIKDTDPRYVFNLIFTRDHFLMTPRGAIMSRMFSNIRRDEVKYAERALKTIGVHIRKAIRDNGTFEGADALWINNRLVVVGVGNRTNQEGFRQVKQELGQDNVKCVPIPAPKNIIHLLGALQFVDAGVVLVREDAASPEIINLLKKNRIKTIMVPENAEIKEKQAMNFVTIAPRAIIMPALCPKTKKIYENSQIKIAAEILAVQLVRGAGGIGCVTAILARA